MILVDKPKLKFLLTGRTITVTVHHDRFKKGRSYAVGMAHNKPATCSATVVGIKVTASGRELEIRQNRDSTDLYMARYSPHGYTTELADALGCEDAPVVPRSELKQLAAANRRRLERERYEQVVRQEARSISAKLRDAIKREDAPAILALRRELTRLARRVEAA